MDNENLGILCGTVLALGLIFAGLDDGGFIKYTISFLIGMGVRRNFDLKRKDDNGNTQ
jgi:hypothetical protein